MIEEITLRFENESENIRAQHNGSEFDPINLRERRRYYYFLQWRMSHAIIREVGDYIIRPYSHYPQETISKFLTWYESRDPNMAAGGDRPAQINDFMNWYCNSDVIQAEVDAERIKRNDSPRP